MKKNIVKICVCMLVMATALPVAGSINKTIDQKATETSTPIHNPLQTMGHSFFQGECIVWDNNGYGITSYHAQDDPPETTPEIDSFEADDFQFDVDTSVHWVWWPSSYWNCNYKDGPKDYHYDWNITFYNDDGTGNRPDTLYAGPFTIADADIYKSREVWNLTDIANGLWVAYNGVLLPEPVTFLSNSKYWISIYSIGPHFPQSGWYISNGTDGDPIKLHEGVFKSTHWGYPEWTNLSEDWGEPADMVFILGGELLPFDVSIKKGLGITATIENQLPEPYYQTNITVTFTVSGGFVLNPSKTFFINQLNVSETETLNFYPLGFGLITVEIVAISQDSAAMGLGTNKGLLLFVFII